MGHPLTPSHCTRTRTTLPGKLLKTNITLLGCFGFFTMFLAQWLNWYNFSVYESRFSANDAAHRVGLRLSWLSWGGVTPTSKHGVFLLRLQVFKLLQSLGALCAAMHAGDWQSMNKYKLGFAIGCLVARLATMLQ